MLREEIAKLERIEQLLRNSREILLYKSVSMSSACCPDEKTEIIVHRCREATDIDTLLKELDSMRKI